MPKRESGLASDGILTQNDQGGCAETFYATLGEAVKAYLDSHPVEWVDWEQSPA